MSYFNRTLQSNLVKIDSFVKKNFLKNIFRLESTESENENSDDLYISFENLTAKE